MSQQSTKSIVVDIDQANRAKAYSADESFYQREIEIVLSLLEQDANGIIASGHDDRRTQNETEEVMLHARDVICVYGARGAGKTSFLRSVAERINNPSSHRDDQRASLGQLHVLPLLDPTLIERNEVFLATIVSNVLGAIQQRYQTRRRGGVADDALTDHEPLRRALDELARAFRLLAPGGVESSWRDVMADPHLFAHEVLQDAASGRQLALRFHRFVSEAARVLGIEAFVQPLDDVDTAYQQGWQVLETTRKYLSTRRFIPLISGDIELYRMLVRATQIEHVQRLVDFENRFGTQGSRPDFANFRRQLDQLEEQYMLKLMPAERRVRLRAVRDRIWSEARRDNELIVVTTARTKPRNDKSTTTVPLSTLISSYAADVFGWRRGVSTRVLVPGESIAARLLPERTRSLMSLLNVLVDWKTNDAKRPDLLWVEELYRVFEQALITRDLDIDLLSALKDGDGLGRLSQWILERRDEITQLHSLDPDRLLDRHDAEAWIAAVLVISGALYQRWQTDPGAALRFAAKVTLPALQAESDASQGTVDVAAPGRHIVTRLSLEANEMAYHTASRLLAHRLTIEKLNLQRPGPGVLWLPRRKVKKHDARVETEWLRLISRYGLDGNVEAGEDSAGNDLPTIDVIPWFEVIRKTATPREAVFFSRVTFGNAADTNVCEVLDWFSATVSRSGGAMVSYLDVVRGLGALGDWVSAPSSESSAYYHRILSDAEGFSPGVGPRDLDAEEEEPSSRNSRGSSKVREPSWLLKERMIRWAEAVRATSHPDFALAPPRFHQVVVNWWENLVAIESESDLKYQTVGGMLHRWIAAFFRHHMSVEEAESEPVGARGAERLRRDILGTSTFSSLVADRAMHGSEAGADRIRRAATAVWMSCPLLLCCLTKPLREQVWRAARICLADHAGWQAYFATLSENLQGECPAFDARLWMNNVEVEADIQTLLTALVSPSRLVGEEDADLSLGRQRLAELCGWDTSGDDPTGPKPRGKKRGPPPSEPSASPSTPTT